MNASTDLSSAPLLLCCDLDRTLVPNGDAAESPDARPRFRALCAGPSVHLAMVTGRHLDLVLDAIDRWQLPPPQFIIGDVGTTIYTAEDGSWVAWSHWHAAIGPDWGGMTTHDISEQFADLDALKPQPRDCQGTFKASYLVRREANRELLEAELVRRLWAMGINARLVWSVDEAADCLLLDILPASASKLHAIEFLGQHCGYPVERIVFAGDSGNDLEVLGSHIRSVLVANAHPEVRARAEAMVAASDLPDALYVAQGGLFDMNGNYAAGVLEGLAHFVPETRAWMALPSN